MPASNVRLMTLHDIRLPKRRSQRPEGLRTRVVLSIGKLGAGQARYYLDQAEGRVDVVDSVGDGIEEYYGGGAEARGEWIGAAGVELGLAGAVDGGGVAAGAGRMRSAGRSPLR